MHRFAKARNYKNFKSKSPSKKIFNKLLALTSLLLISYIIYTSQHKDIFLIKKSKQYIDNLAKNFGFTLQNIDISNSENYCVDFKNDPEIIKYYNQSILSTPIHKIRSYIESVDCVDNVNIKTILPNKLHLNIKTKKPIALLQHNKRFYFITNNGDTIKIRNSDMLADIFEKFIIITGENAPKNTLNLFQIITSGQEIYSHIASAMWVGNRRWNIKFSNGTELMLPEENPEIAWQKFINMYNTHKEFHDWKYKTIDFRIEGKIYTN